MRQPNILFLLTDNQRSDMMGCAGHPILKTPNMDRLAAGGVRFENAFTTSPICAASRASYLTGLQEWTHRYTFLTPPLRMEFVDISYPAILKRAGYHTGFVGKLGFDQPSKKSHIEDVDNALEKMFDVFQRETFGDPPAGYFRPQPDGTYKHLTEVNCDRAIDFLRGSDDERPWCLSVSFQAPHADENVRPSIYTWPPAMDGLYEDATVTPPTNSEPEFFEALPEFLQLIDDRDRWQQRFSTPELYQSNMKGMFRMVTGVDAAVGSILDEIESLGMTRDTVVIYASDHGMLFGERGLADCSLLYEQPIRVPLIVYDPREGRTQRGITEDKMALNIDVAPMILDLAGLEIPEQMQGRSLTPLIQAEDPSWREEIFLEHLFNGWTDQDFHRQKGIRTEMWKYICFFELDPPYEELYDLENDPAESVNLVGRSEHAALLEHMRQRCSSWDVKL